jgi:hypothetical protein
LGESGTWQRWDFSCAFNPILSLYKLFFSRDTETAKA